LASRESPDRCEGPALIRIDRLRETDENPFLAAITASVGTGWPTYRKEGLSLSAFALEDGVIYHTYSSFERGVDAISGMYPWPDHAPLGRTGRIGQRRALAARDRGCSFPGGTTVSYPFDTEGPVESTEASGSCWAIRRERHAPNRECYRDLGSRESP